MAKKTMATGTKAKAAARRKTTSARPGKPAKGPARGARKGGVIRKGPAAQKATPRAPSRPKRASAAPGDAASRMPDEARPTAIAIATAALDKKAEDVLVLDVRGLTSYADYFVVMTADSDRQASAIADHVAETMKKMGIGKVGVEGYETGRWILVDYGDVVAHVMNQESRGFYDLEGLWADAPRFRID